MTRPARTARKTVWTGRYGHLPLYNHMHVFMLSKFVGPVGQSDIFYEKMTKNDGVLDQMSNRK